MKRIVSFILVLCLLLSLCAFEVVNDDADPESSPEVTVTPTPEVSPEVSPEAPDVSDEGPADPADDESYPAVEDTFADEESGVTVTVSAPEGAFPEGTTVEITPVLNVNYYDAEGESPLEMVHAAIEEALAEEPVTPEVTVAYDITFYSADDEELQPRSGYEVDVTFTVAPESVLLAGEAQELQAFHVSNDMVAQPVGDIVEIVPADSETDTLSEEPVEVAVKADAFSIYAVSSTNWKTTSSDLQGQTIVITRGEDLTIDGITYTSVDEGSQLRFSGTEGTTQGTNHNRSWISSNKAVADVEPVSDKTYRATVTIGDTDGTTILTYKYWTRDWNLIQWDWDYTEHTETLTIIVQSIYIEDTIPTDGCLIPKWNIDLPEGHIEYEWYKSDVLTANTVDAIGTSNPASDDAVSKNYAGDTNGVNVAVDDGGKCWYYVKAIVTAENGEVKEYISNPYWVPYSNKLENGSFEVPVITSGYNTQLNQDNAIFAVTPEHVADGSALWWKTMGRGTGNNAGKDIELITTNTTKKSALKDQFKIDTADPNDLINPGNQFAEINAEAYGSLYQDVLTAPGTELNWSLMHRGRWGTDTMAVVIMPADEVADLPFNNQTDMRNWVDAHVEGGSAYNSKIYVYKITTDNKHWESYQSSEPYVVPEGQYLTRFFFVHYEANGSKNSTSGKMPDDLKGTVGNLVDGINFSDEIPYTINFYVDNAFQETVTGQEKPFKLVTANTNNYSSYALEKIELNGEAYGSTTMRILNGQNVLDIYYVTKGMSVIKEVQGIPDDMELSGYTVTFDVYEDATKVASATVTINGTVRSGTAVFYQLDGAKFIPTANTTYTIKESGGAIQRYKITSGNTDQTLTPTIQAATVTFTNVYEKSDFDITITKNIVDGGTPDQSFIFDVKNSEGTVINTVIMTPEQFENGKCTVTVTGLESGTYTVTERTNWSWRYALTTQNDVSVSDSTTTEAKFTNEQTKFKWLSGGCSAVNRWTGGTVNEVSETAAVLPKKEDEDA